MEGAWGSTPSMEWRMSERATAASSDVNRLLGDRITAATTQTESSTTRTATPTPRTASTVPRWCRRTVTLLQVPRTRPAEPSTQAVKQDERDDDDGAGDVAVPPLEQRHPDDGPEQEAEKEPAEGEDLDDGPEPQPVDGGQQHQPDDQQVDPIHRCEGIERCTGKCTPHRYSRRAVLPRSVFRHWRVRRRSGGLSLVLAAVAITASGCSLSGHPGSTKVARVLGEPKGTPLAVGQPAPSGTGELGAVSCATVRRCWAVGVAGPNPAPATGATVIAATTNGGASWKAQQVAGGSTPQLSGVSCPTATECMAVGSNGASLPGSGVVITTSDAGATWTAAASPQNALVVASVTCASPTDCTAIVSDGTSTWSAHSADFGQSWQQEGNLPLALPARERPDVRGRRHLHRRRLRPDEQRPRTGSRGRERRRRADVGIGIGALGNRSAAEHGVSLRLRLPRGRHDRDDGQRRRPGQG